MRLVTKPGTMIFISLWFWQISHWQRASIWFGVGLLASLVGDILLLHPRRFFLGGLVAFLCAHLFYITGFNIPLPSFQLGIIPMIAFIGLLGWIVLPRVLRGVRGKLRIAVVIYAGVISLMVLSALNTLIRSDWAFSAAIMVSTGACLFFISDTLLSLNRFVRPIPNIWVMISYHLGQLALAGGALWGLNFLG